jgi:nucleoside-diphosphate-sugar epimerase
MSESWLIVGCGYTGTRLARALVGQGADVTITRRDSAAASELAGQLGARGLRVDLAEANTLRGAVPPGAIVVCLAPPGPEPAAEIAGMLDAAREAARFVYVSSTGVYPAAGGAWVDESWLPQPATASGLARRSAEEMLGNQSEPARPWISLRAAGIYGPGRGLAERIAAGTYRIVGDGRAHISRIHVVDLVAAIIAAGRSTYVGWVNVADDDPAPIGEVADAVAAHLGKPPPPRVPADSVSPEIAGMLTADRRIANTLMKRELGVVLRYPSWRDAL